MNDDDDVDDDDDFVLAFSFFFGFAFNDESWVNGKYGKNKNKTIEGTAFVDYVTIISTPRLCTVSLTRHTTIHAYVVLVKKKKKKLKLLTQWKKIN